MTTWSITVVEEDDHHIYRFGTWKEVLDRLALFDGLSVEYSVTHSTPRPWTDMGQSREDWENSLTNTD